MKYWAKTTQEGEPGTDVDDHMFHIAMVARLLLVKHEALCNNNDLQPSSLSFLAGLHDVGKISQGFQVKCKAWLELNSLIEESISFAWKNSEHDHSKVTQFTVEHFLVNNMFQHPRSSAIWWAASLGAHHGRLHYPGEKGISEKAGMSKDKWEEARQEAAMKLFTRLDPDKTGGISLPPVNEESPGQTAWLWYLAGLTSVADWIGSQESLFPSDRDLSKKEIHDLAAMRLDALGLLLPQVRQGLLFDDMFPFPPNPLQVLSMEYIQKPGVHVIEAPMGMGKTEAALACAYRLLCQGTATGIYFALPTQTTSNRIHSRLSNFVRKICPNEQSPRLIHTNSWLMVEDFVPLNRVSTGKDDEGVLAARDWFNSAKRALMSPFGAGTVDQALLAIVASKHFFVRRFALAGKVVIIDEIHSYDIYTGSLILALCEELVQLGCTVILLSATLTRERRKALLKEDGEDDRDEPGNTPDPYPLISGKTSGGIMPSRTIAQELQQKTVKLRFLPQEEALEKALSRARQGACLLWVCNTVHSAQATYSRLKAASKGNVPLGLLHARFPFFRRIELEEQWLSLFGKEGDRPEGCILVSTQIVEQSVDIDADVMVTELAPSDMLLQRLGRLWRHKRPFRPVKEPQCWTVAEECSLDEAKEMAAKDLTKMLGSKARVYHPYVLLRTWVVWTKLRSITLPSHIRSILEETYIDQDDLPGGWCDLRNEVEGERFAKRLLADFNTNIFNPSLPDDEGVQTRCTTFPTLSLVLTKSGDEKQGVLQNGDRYNLDGDVFCLDTARALHRNLVRVPKWPFDSFKSTEATGRYLHGEQALVLVKDNGLIAIDSCKDMIHLHYTAEYGVEIRNNKGGQDESCD